MKNQLKFFLAAWLSFGVLFTSCTEDQPRPETLDTLTTASEARKDKESGMEQGKGQLPSQITQLGENSYLISWIFEDDVVMLSEPVISLLVEEGLATTLYLTADGILEPNSVFEDHLMKTVIEDNIILLADYVDNVELRIIAEDQIMLLNFSVNGEPVFSSSLTIIEDII